MRCTIKLNKFGKCGAILFILGFCALAIGLPLTLISEVSDRSLGLFENGMLSLHLSPSDSNLYVVADIDKISRRDSISDMSVLIEFPTAEVKTVQLENKASVSHSPSNSLYGERASMGYFQVNVEGEHKLTITNINKTKGVRDTSYSLHQSSNRVVEGAIVIVGIFLLIVGILLLGFNILSFGLNKLFSR